MRTMAKKAHGMPDRPLGDQQCRKALPGNTLTQGTQFPPAADWGEFTTFDLDAIRKS
jgi:hypothetical protein